MCCEMRTANKCCLVIVTTYIKAVVACRVVSAVFGVVLNRSI